MTTLLSILASCLIVACSCIILAIEKCHICHTISFFTHYDAKRHRPHIEVGKDADEEDLQISESTSDQAH